MGWEDWSVTYTRETKKIDREIEKELVIVRGREIVRERERVGEF